MPTNDHLTFPMVVLLLNRVRRVAEAEARRLVASELGVAAAATVRTVSDNAAGMSYIDWYVGPTPYHLGTSSEPYINAVGVGKADPETGRVGAVKWSIREEVPPEADEHCEAWMSHAAWLYVDALLFHSPTDEHALHRQNVLRIAGQLIDERCVLVWLWGREPKQVALPTPKTVAALRAGKWPG